MKRERSSLTSLQEIIARLDKEIFRLYVLESKSRQKWTHEYDRYRSAVRQLVALKKTTTKKADKLRQIIENWDSYSECLTKLRDEKREAIKERVAKQQEFRIELARLEERLATQVREMDDLVTQVFSLNSAVVEAHEAMNLYLSAHVFNRLVNHDGKLLSQLTLDSSDGLRRVVVLVNTITRIQSDIAAEAMREIDVFLSRFQRNVHLDESAKALFDLTSQLLVEKTSFKVGPELYRFLTLDLSASIFPELQRAQILLRGSLRSEKTNSYVRLYARANRDTEWRSVAQS